MTDNPFELVLDRLREKGWIKGRLGATSGPNCINGAHLFSFLDDFATFRSTLNSVITTQYPELAKTVNRPECIIPEFNNHPDTTFADVERVLEKAAVKWEEERVLRND